MRIAALLLPLAALGACATSLPQVVITGGDTFEVRYDASAQTTQQADAAAATHCGAPAAFVSAETKFDGFAYRTYRCAGR